MVKLLPTIGNTKVTRPVIISIAIPVLRRPNLSMIEPITGASSNPGIAVIEIRTPALVAEPVS